ncbi:MAG TPA: hypothetical protein VFY57_06465, partial [Rubrobacteraceae bacterium]|nr:hypothetical protein [Rubrobacteraceae bacterium]
EDWYRLVLETELPAGDPLDLKLALARWIVRRSHGDEAAARAEEHFTRVVREGLPPDDKAIPTAPLPPGDPVHMPAALASAFDMSTSEARRLIAQSGVELDGARLDELDVPRSQVTGALVRAGKRRFVRFLDA